MKKPMIRLVILLVVGLVAVGGLLGYYASERSKTLSRLATEGTKQLENSDLYKNDKEYFTLLYNHAQPLAKKQVNGLLKPSVKEEEYYTALLTEMARKAKADGKVDVAQKLRTYGTGKGWVGVKLD